VCMCVCVCFLIFFPLGFESILGLYLLRAFQLFFVVFNDGFALVLFLQLFIFVCFTLLHFTRLLDIFTLFCSNCLSFINVLFFFPFLTRCLQARSVQTFFNFFFSLGASSLNFPRVFSISRSYNTLFVQYNMICCILNTSLRLNLTTFILSKYSKHSKSS